MTLTDGSTPPSAEPVSDEGRVGRDWPDIPSEHPTAKWHAVAQERIDGLHYDVRDVHQILRRMDERQARGGPATRIALAVVASMTKIAESPNMKYIAAVIVGLAVLAWGGAVTWGDLTIGSVGATPSPRPAHHGPALAPTDAPE